MVGKENLAVKKILDKMIDNIENKEISKKYLSKSC